MAFNYTGSRLRIMNPRIAQLLGNFGQEPLPGPLGLPPSGEKATSDISALFDQYFPGEGGPLNDMIMELGRKVMDAKGAETSAQQELQQATQAPPPTFSPEAAMVGRSLARAGGQLQRTDAPQQNMEGFLKDQQAMLLQQRTENLVRLNKQYERAADRAEKLGDLETTIKYRKAYDLNIEKVKALTGMQDEIYKQGNLNWREMFKGGIDLRVAEMSANARSAAALGDPEGMQALTDMVWTGDADFKPLSTQAKIQIAKNLRAQGKFITPPLVKKAKGELTQAEYAINEMQNLMTAIPGGKPGLKGIPSRAKAGGQALLEGITQPETGDVATFNTSKKGFGASLARLRGEVGVLTQKDVDTSLELIPKWTDSAETRANKWRVLRNFLKAKYNGALVANMTPYAGIGFNIEELKTNHRMVIDPMKIRMIDPSGRQSGSIDSSELEDALQNGWRIDTEHQ